MKSVKTFITLIFFLFSLSCFSQVKVTSYSIYAIGVSAPFNDLFAGEIKVFTNQGQLFENTSIELSGSYKFVPKPYHQFSVGLGFGLIPESGEDAFFSAPLSLEIFPIQSFKQLSVVIEVAPEYYFNNEILNLRHLWGIRYSFEKSARNEAF
ncbi:hypothetical protein [Draconibacterium sediminis]|uniref:Outer membrane protein beta-barrel domain-containing protein n=1 Tax=Draconibacterium sediminis TaxID=1544798 RepID=A0A0D8JB40_9BACT|nr:hypothetical protein [Draconibacterium sediminis]KJF43023.1 hypothetical protein LH29_16680 [Draconibacterium sediminis]